MDTGWDLSRWNGWQLNDNFTLYYEPAFYEIDLEYHALTSARMLDMILQIANKSWGTDAAVAGLVQALNDIIAPQATLCSNGISTPLTAKRVRDLVRGKFGK
jgi:hypothetical protein